jgi:ATP-dependent DNA ligase
MAQGLTENLVWVRVPICNCGEAFRQEALMVLKEQVKNHRRDTTAPTLPQGSTRNGIIFSHVFSYCSFDERI